MMKGHCSKRYKVLKTAVYTDIDYIVYDIDFISSSIPYSIDFV